jgi:hypothetical protein
MVLGVGGVLGSVGGGVVGMGCWGGIVCSGG